MLCSLFAECEDSAQLGPHKCSVCQVAGRAEANLIFHNIADGRSWKTITVGGQEFVSVTPEFEWSPSLNVNKVPVNFELHNARHPCHPKWQVWKQAKGNHDLRTRPGQLPRIFGLDSRLRRRSKQASLQ